MKKLENILRKLEFGFFSFDNSIIRNDNYMYYELEIDKIKYRIIRTYNNDFLIVINNKYLSIDNITRKIFTQKDVIEFLYTIPSFKISLRKINIDILLNETF